MIVVASADETGRRLPSSNYGAKTFIGARALFHSGTADGGHEYMGMTSQAAPNVANAVAKMLLIDPTLEPPDIRRILAATARKDDAWTDRVFAGGVLDTRAATTLTALEKRVRGGDTADEAARHLGLKRAERAALLPLLRGG